MQIQNACSRSDEIVGLCFVTSTYFEIWNATHSLLPPIRIYWIEPIAQNQTEIVQISCCENSKVEFKFRDFILNLFGVIQSPKMFIFWKVIWFRVK